MRITILTNIEPGEKVDPVVSQVGRVLRQLKHEVSVLKVHADPNQLVRGLARRRPELVFHLLEMFGENVNGDIPVAGTMDLYGYRYTGSGPGELYLANDKALSKKILAYDEILVPRFAVFGLVNDAPSLMKRVALIHRELNDAALAEEYIDGREFHVGVLGNGEPIAFPPIEIDFSGLAEGKPRILSAKAKFDEKSAEFKGTKAVVAKLPDELRARLQDISLRAYRALRVRDYGRVDLRLTPMGEIYFLELNASCYLEKKSEFAMGARAAGIEYPDLIGRIVELALGRYQAAAQK